MIFVDTLRQGEGQGWLLPQEIFSLRTRRLGRLATLKVRWLIKPHPRTRTHPTFSPKGPSLVPKLIFSFPRGCQTVSQRLSPPLHSYQQGTPLPWHSGVWEGLLNFCSSRRWKMPDCGLYLHQLQGGWTSSPSLFPLLWNAYSYLLFVFLFDSLCFFYWLVLFFCNIKI